MTEDETGKAMREMCLAEGHVGRLPPTVSGQNTCKYKTRIRSMASRGKTPVQIAATLGITRQHVYGIARQHGIVLPPSGPNARRKRR